MNPQLTCFQRQWLHSLVGKAVAPVSRGHGFKPRWSPEFFSGFCTQLHKLRSLRRSFLHFHFISAVHIWFISYIINTAPKLLLHHNGDDHIFIQIYFLLLLLIIIIRIIVHYHWAYSTGRHLFPSAKLTFSSQWLLPDISLFLHEISPSLEISVHKSLSLFNF